MLCETTNLPEGKIDLFRFYQKHSSTDNQNGNFRAAEVNVETSNDNSTWTTVSEGLCIPYGADGYVKLPESINAKYIRLTFTRNETSLGNGTYLAMNEIEAYGVENVNVVVHVNDVANISDNATDEVTAGSQITAESSIISGKPYLVYYVGNGESAYMKDTGTAYTGKNDTNPTKNAVYYFTTGGTSGTWNVQNYITGKYWGVPPSTNSTAYAGSSTAGNWSLNFQSNNNIAPTCYDSSGSTAHSWNRSGNNLHPWSSGTANVNQFRIYEVASSSTALSELTSKDIVVSSTAAETVRTGQWYVMFDRGTNHGYLYENSSSHTLYNTSTAPCGYAPDNAKYLVRIVGENGNYYLQTGFGNYFGEITQSTAVPTTALKEQLITIKKISDTDGHYYLASSSGRILDANACNAGDATVVGWNTTIPTSTGGNNDWAFYPVEFVESWEPTASEVYTINNTNPYRGALIYNPDNANYVWSSGKSGTFDASNANSQWVFIPTGDAREYYLYNVGAGKFAVNTAVASGSANAWVFSDNAAAVTLIQQSDGTYKIKAARGRANDGTNNAIMAVSNNYTGPIINYDDVGSLFTITKVEGANQSTAANTAKAKLVKSQTALTAVPSTSGWYAIQIRTAGTAGFVGRYFKNLESEYYYSSNSTNYPLTFTGPVDIEPSMKDPTYFTYIDVTNNYWQMPNGKFLVLNGNNKFPTSSVSPAAITMGYDSNGSYLKCGSYYAVTYNSGQNYFIGESPNAKYLYIYPIDLTEAGLTAWTVTIRNAPATAALTCTRSDVSGLTEVYNNGTFFLPSGTTPVNSDFTLTGMTRCTVNATNHTITAECNPIGDVNLDGQVTIADVTALVNIILGKATDQYGVADINDDEQVTIADVTALVNIILGK